MVAGGVVVPIRRSTSSSAMDYSRTIHLIGSFGDRQDALVKEYEALEKRLKAERARVERQKEAADVMLADGAPCQKVVADSTAIAHGVCASP